VSTPRFIPLAKFCCSFALGVGACQVDSRVLVQLPLSEAGAGGDTDVEVQAGQAGAGGISTGDSGGSPSLGGTSSFGGTSGLGESGAGGDPSPASGGHSGGASSTSKGGTTALGGGGSAGKAASGGGAGTSGGGTANSGGTSSAGGAAGAGKGGASALWCPDLDNNHVPDCTETLVKDATFEPPFNAGQSNWKLDASASASWDGLDAGVGGSSGSLLLTNAMGGSETLSLLGAGQCISATAGKVYRAVAQSYAQASQGSGFARLSITYFAESGCTGAALLVNVSPLDGTTNSWRLLEIAGSQAPGTTTSMLVRLEVLKLATTPSSAVHFDNVLIKGG